MRTWEWLRDCGTPIWVGLGDPLNHWNRRHQYRNDLTEWLCQFDEMPTPCTRWHLDVDWEGAYASAFARSRMQQIRSWAGWDCLLNRAGGGVAYVPPRGPGRLFDSTRKAGQFLGVSHVLVLQRAWRGTDGVFWR